MKLYYLPMTHECVTSAQSSSIELTKDDIALWVGETLPKGKVLKSGVYPFVLIDDPSINLQEHLWVVEELKYANIQITYHEDNSTRPDGSSRATSSESEWRRYRVLLQNYTSQTDDGLIMVNGERPSRPA